MHVGFIHVLLHRLGYRIGNHRQLPIDEWTRCLEQGDKQLAGQHYNADINYVPESLFPQNMQFGMPPYWGASRLYV